MLQRMSSAEDEGRPVEGPLPLELQQIRAESQAAALAARRRSEDVKSGKEISIKVPVNCDVNEDYLPQCFFAKNLSAQ